MRRAKYTNKLATGLLARSYTHLILSPSVWKKSGLDPSFMNFIFGKRSAAMFSFFLISTKPANVFTANSISKFPRKYKETPKPGD